MKKLAALFLGIFAVVVLAGFAKPQIINAGDFLVRQPLLSIRAELNSVSAEVASLRADMAVAFSPPPAPTPPAPVEPAVSNGWELVTDNAPFRPRDGSFVASFKGYIWLGNGWPGSSDNMPTSIWRSRDGKDWERVVDNAPWEGRHIGNFVVLNDRMYMYGGDNMTDVWSSADGINWRLEIAEAPWGKRYNPYMGAFDGKLWLMGGQNEHWTGAYNDVWSSVDGKTWVREVENAPWPRRSLVSGFAVHDGHMWVMGGGRKIPDQRCNGCGQTLYDLNDVWKSPNGVDWELVIPRAEWAPRTHMSVAGYDGNLIVTDGSVGTQAGMSSEAWFSKDGIEWHPIGGIPDQKFSPRHASTLVEHDGTLFMVTGYLRNDVWRLNPDALTVPPTQ